MELNIVFWFWIFIILGSTGSVFTPNKEIDELQPAFHVTEAQLSANPTEFSGPCPAEIKFKAKITVTGGPGIVVFEILRSDNVPAPTVTMYFNETETKDTTYTWKADQSFLGWHQLMILKPNELKSNQAEVSVMCQQ